ncbi:hypothetical protein PS2_012486 [Malus domestica]
MEQEPRIPVSLHEYFPNDFFQQCTIAACHMVEVEIEEPSKGKDITTEGEKILTFEEGLPTHFSIEEELRLPKKMRIALVAVLESPNDHEVQESKNEGFKLRPHEYATCCTIEDTIHFTRRRLAARIQASQLSSLRLWIRKGAQSQPHACGWWISHKHHAKVNND